MAISLIAMATVTLILFLDVIFELIEQEFRLHSFLVLLSTVFVQYVCFQRN